jgi:hypothetical protein
MAPLLLGSRVYQNPLNLKRVMQRPLGCINAAIGRDNVIPNIINNVHLGDSESSRG